MKQQLIRAAATTVLGLSLTTGFAAADISGTGNSSHNTVKTTSDNSQKVTNSNSLGANNSNSQSAKSGDVSAWDNTTVTGDSGSGDASNGNTVHLTASVDNSGGGTVSSASVSDPATAGDISNTGNDSSNTITVSTSNKTTVQNTNNLSVSNSNSQSAVTGNVKVGDNTTAGGATSGDATNTADSTISLEVTN